MWGVGLLIELVVRVTLAFTLTINQFLLISSILSYGFLGVLLLLTLVFARIRRNRQRRALEQLPEQQTRETSRTPI